MLKIEVTPKAVLQGGTISVKISDYVGLRGKVNLQIDVVLVEIERDHFCFSTVTEVIAENNFVVEMKVPDGVRPGPCVVARLSLVEPDNIDTQRSESERQEQLISETNSLGDIAFTIVKPDRNGVLVEPQEFASNLILKLRRARTDRIHRPIRVGEGDGRKYQVLIFVSRMLVHHIQHCEGFSLLPYGAGLSAKPIEDVLNAFMLHNFCVTFSLTDVQEREFSSQRPLGVIILHTVLADTAELAMSGTRDLVENILLALAFERGQLPEPIACVVSDGRDFTFWLYNRPYSGNWLAPFSSSETGAEIERLAGAMARSPFCKLLQELYVQALSEADLMFRYFRFWAILELLAKRSVPDSAHHIFDSHGTRILLPNGQPVTTSKAEAKVYKYLSDQGCFGSNASVATPDGFFTIVVEGSSVGPPLTGPGIFLSFWDFVQAIYAIRNAVAHSGRFVSDASADPQSAIGIASKVLTSPMPGVLLQELQVRTRLVVLKELSAL